MINLMRVVLPVTAQLAALPADETLLRSSDQPAATPGELLRAVRMEQVRTERARPYASSEDRIAESVALKIWWEEDE